MIPCSGKKGCVILLRGFIAIVLASLCFGIAPSGSKYVLSSGMKEDCQVLYQCFCMVVLYALSILVKKRRFRLPMKDSLELIMLGAIGLGGTDYLVALAFGQLNVGTAVMIHFMFPSLVLLATVVFFGRKLSLLSFSAVVVSAAGLYCAATPSGGLPIVGLLGALGSAITYSIFVIANDRSNVAHYPTVIRMFYMSLGATIFALGKVSLSGSFSLPISRNVSLVLFGAVAFLCAVGYLLMAYGTERIGAAEASFLSMLEPAFGALFGILIYHEVISPKALIGYLLIPLSIFLIAKDDSKQLRAKSSSAFPGKQNV